MKEIAGKKVILTEGEFLRREEANKRYLMKLETPYLLRSYLHEAGSCLLYTSDAADD